MWEADTSREGTGVIPVTNPIHTSQIFQSIVFLVIMF